MGIAEDMKRVAEEIVSSYQSRISTVAMIIDNTHQLLEDFKNKRNEMSEHLKETLAKEESLRKKDFDYMMKDILYHQDEREKEVRDLLKTFFEEQKEIAEIIKKNLSEGQKVRINDFKKMLQHIQARQKAREDEVKTTLEAFQKEYKEMAESLRSLLNKGEAIRISEFKAMVKDIQRRQIERAKEVRRRLVRSTPRFRVGNGSFGYHRREPVEEEVEKPLTAIMAEKRAEGGESREKEEVAKV